MTEVVYRIYEARDSIIIHNVLKSKLISIDTGSYEINLSDLEYLDNKSIINSHKSLGILGLIRIGVHYFLCFIKSSKKIGNILQTEVFEISDIDLLHITNDRNIKIKSDIITILDNLKILFKQGFYYSHNYDLTNSLQYQIKIKLDNNKNYDYIKNSNPNFLWNRVMYKNFFRYDVDNDFLVNCIYGYVGIITEKINEGSVLNYILISRKSTLNVGLKKFKKGIDEEGYVANYVETEQILFINKNFFSYVQARGNPPVFYNFFDSKNQNEDYDNLLRLFDKYLENILNNQLYKLSFIFNLMDDFKDNENKLTGLLQQLIKEKELNNLRYSFFNYDNRVNNQNSHNENIHELNILNNIESNTNNPNHKKEFNEDSIQSKFKEYDAIFKLFNFFGIYHDSTSLDNMSNSDKVMCEQLGIFMTICLDSLDKTNIIQMRIAWKILLIQMSKINLDGNILFGNNFNYDKQNDLDINKKLNILSIDDIFSKTNNNTSNMNMNVCNPNFLKNFKTLWKENGNKLSIEYNGDRLFLDSEGENEFNAYKSQQINEDFIKQKCFEFLLQKSSMKFEKKINPTMKDSQQNLNGQLTDKKNDPLAKDTQPNFIDQLTVKKLNPSVNDQHPNLKDQPTEKLILFVGSWNVGGKSLKDSLNLLEWLQPKKYLKTTPDIYIIGLQEIVELNANFLMISSNMPWVQYWKDRITKNLNVIDNYQMIQCLNLVGVFMIVFVKSSVRDRIRKFDHVILKTGFMGTLGNKGSCIIRFNYYETTFAISCGHFSAGSSATNSRVNELIEILNKEFPSHKDLKFKDHDVAIIFGDLNFRIDLDINTCLSIIDDNDLKQLRLYDQFLKSKEVNPYLFDIEEGNLNFKPTYKYVVGSLDYDSKKKRVPSWCDRVLYMKSKFIQQTAYDRVEYTYSDHRPIHSIFELYPVKNDFDIKETFFSQIRCKSPICNKPEDYDSYDSKFGYNEKSTDFDYIYKNEQDHGTNSLFK